MKTFRNGSGVHVMVSDCHRKLVYHINLCKVLCKAQALSLGNDTYFRASTASADFECQD